MEKWKIALKICRKMIKIKENKLSATHYIPLSSKRKIKKLEEEIHVYIMMYSSYADSLQIMYAKFQKKKCRKAEIHIINFSLLAHTPEMVHVIRVGYGINIATQDVRQKVL